LSPDAATAAAYVEQGMLWNSGNCLFSPAVMLEELEQNAPAVLAAARDALDKAITDLVSCVSTRCVSRRAEDFDRLCRDGKDPPRRRAARKFRLVGCRPGRAYGISKPDADGNVAGRPGHGIGRAQ
jgi:enamine deaminase RidA (YjgF/YER057c/UK114 family)